MGRKTAQNCLELIAKIQNKSLSEIVGPYANQIIGSILVHPFTLLPPVIQTGPSPNLFSFILSSHTHTHTHTHTHNQIKVHLTSHISHTGNENSKMDSFAMIEFFVACRLSWGNCILFTIETSHSQTDSWYIMLLFNTLQVAFLHYSLKKFLFTKITFCFYLCCDLELIALITETIPIVDSDEIPPAHFTWLGIDSSPMILTLYRKL
jgi:hypothetical protein